MSAFAIVLTLCLIGISFASPRNADSAAIEGNEVVDTKTIRTSDDTQLLQHEHLLESRKKKGGMEQMYMMFMMCKSVISTLMMLIQPIFQVKALAISFIGMLINLAKFLVQLKMMKSGGGGGGSGFGGGFGGGFGEGLDRVGSSLPAHINPNYISKYTISE